MTDWNTKFAASLRAVADVVERGEVSTLVLLFETADPDTPMEVRVLGDRASARDPVLGRLVEAVWGNLASVNVVRDDWGGRG